MKKQKKNFRINFQFLQKKESKIQATPNPENGKQEKNVGKDVENGNTVSNEGSLNESKTSSYVSSDSGIEQHKCNTITLLIIIN